MLTPKQMRLARLVAGGKPSAEVKTLLGDACGPTLNPNGSVRVGQHFWWGFLISDDRTIDDVIEDWLMSRGEWYTSAGEVDAAHA